MKSILWKILVYLGSAVLISTVCIGLVTTSYVSQMVLGNEARMLRDDGEKSILHTANYFSDYIGMMQQMARDNTVVELLSSDIDRSNYKEAQEYPGIFAMLNRAAASDRQNILTTYMAKANANFAFDNEDWLSSEDFDLKQREYGFNSQQDIERGFIICDPYFDDSANSMLTTISAPVYKAGGSGMAGVVAVDLRITAICDMVLDAASNYETGYRVLISDQGYVLAHKDQENVLKKYTEIGFDQALIDAINHKSDELILFSDNGVKSYAVVGEEQKSGWRIVSIVPESEFMAQSKQMLGIILTINAAAICVIMLMILIISRGISKPLARLAKTIDKLAGGDLDVEINISSKDEAGRLAKSMRLFTERLKTYMAYIDEISALLTQMGDGDLNLEFKQSYDGDFRKIKTAIEHASRKLNDTLLECNAAAEQVAGGSNQVSSAAQALSQGATEQASSIEELSATFHEITSQINRTAENARQARQFSEQASVATAHSRSQMEEMVAAMENINATANEIGKIIKSIDDIAFQTNILALNAAVEAARAGEAGKGFAVVADEVRNLAAKSAESAKNTAELIDNTLDAIKHGADIVVETARALQEVVESSEKAASSIQDISQASEKQAQSIYQVNLGVEQISAVIQTNSATAEQSAAASEELNSQAQMLKEYIGQFNLRRGNRSLSQPVLEVGRQEGSSLDAYSCSGSKY